MDMAKDTLQLQFISEVEQPEALYIDESLHAFADGGCLEMAGFTHTRGYYRNGDNENVM
jgi:hypothetical protein